MCAEADSGLDFRYSELLIHLMSAVVRVTRVGEALENYTVVGDSLSLTDVQDITITGSRGVLDDLEPRLQADDTSVDCGSPKETGRMILPTPKS